MSSKYLLNIETGVVWDRTDLLAKEPHMIPCDENGNRIAPEVMPQIVPIPAEYGEDTPPPPATVPPAAASTNETSESQDTPPAKPQERARDNDEVRPEDVKRCVGAIARMVEGKTTKLKEGARIWTRPNNKDKGKPWAESLAIEAGIARDHMTPELRDAAWVEYQKA